MPIRENRIINIENRIFTLENIRELAEILYKEYKEEEGGLVQSKMLDFSVKCFEPASFESSDLSIFASDSIINKKRVESVKLFLDIGNKKKRIHIRLNHGWHPDSESRQSDSDFEVSGDDPFWVSGVAEKINTVINSFEVQETFLLKNKKVIRRMLTLAGMISSVFVLDYYADKEIKLEGGYWVYGFQSLENFIGLLMSTFIMGAIPMLIASSVLFSYSYKLWPTIELRIGPEHSYIEKKRRKITYFFITAFILPIILALVMEVLS